MDGSSASQWCDPQSMHVSFNWSASELLSAPHSLHNQRNGSDPTAVSMNRMIVLDSFVVASMFISSLAAGLWNLPVALIPPSGGGIHRRFHIQPDASLS
jgi:hypothetical protein